MIKVTRLDGKGYYINPLQIESIEVNPNTTLIMQSGTRHIVLEEVDDVLSRIGTFSRPASPPVIQE
jgi:flagellar protein FlbD